MEIQNYTPCITPAGSIFAQSNEELSAYTILVFFLLLDMCHKDVYTELPRNGFCDQTPGHNSGGQKSQGSEDTKHFWSIWEAK